MKIFFLIVLALGCFSKIIVEESSVMPNVDRQLMDEPKGGSKTKMVDGSQGSVSQDGSAIVIGEGPPERNLMDKRTREIRKLVRETIENDLGGGLKHKKHKKRKARKAKTKEHDLSRSINKLDGKRKRQFPTEDADGNVKMGTKLKGTGKKNRKLWFWRRRRARRRRAARRRRMRRIRAARRRRAARLRAARRRARIRRRRAYLARLRKIRAARAARRRAYLRRRAAARRRRAAEAARRRKEAERRRRIAAARAAAAARKRALERARQERLRKERERKRLEEERRQKALMAKREGIFKQLFADIIKYPILYYKRTEYCKVKCSKQSCSRYKDNYICNMCNKKCQEYANTVVSKLSTINRFRKKFFELFMEKNYRCERRDDDVTGQCKKVECRPGYARSAACTQCLAEGKKGAYIACNVDIGDRTPADRKFFRPAYTHYRAKPKKCQECAQDYKGYCSLKCKTDKKCKGHCLKPAQAACRSVCLGPKTTYYRTKFRNIVEKLLGERSEPCKNCDPLCQVEKRGNCYKEDKTCNLEFKKICDHRCKMAKCQKYKDQFHKAIRNAAYTKEYFMEKAQHELQRQKQKQQKRHEYDELRMNKMEDLVFRYNRDTIYDSVLLMEGILYDEQRKLSKTIASQRQEEEQEIMDSILVAYTNQVALDSSDKEYNIFDV